MVATSAASSMFTGITGLMGICMSIAAAVTTFTTPLFIHNVSYNLRIFVCFVASVLSFIICILGSGVPGPAIGTVLAGFVYAFGTSTFLSVATFYDQRTVIAFSTGSGKSYSLLPLTTIWSDISNNLAYHLRFLRRPWSEPLHRIHASFRWQLAPCHPTLPSLRLRPAPSVVYHAHSSEPCCR